MHAESLERIRGIINADRAPADLKRYLTRPGGAQLEALVDRDSPNDFTDSDFRAVNKLSVSVLYSARRWLRGDGRVEAGPLLSLIPAEIDIWEVGPEDYDDVLGPHSPAWRLWNLLYDQQAGARRAGRAVTAGKLLAAKRPRLIPIFDRARVARILKVRRGHFWELIWLALRDNEVRGRLESIQKSVSEASGLSLLRVLDIIVWMSSEPVAV